MHRILLVHGGYIPHYRVPIYSHLSKHLLPYGFELLVTSNGIEPAGSEAVDFRFIKARLSVQSITRIIRTEQIDILISFLQLKHLYLFPTIFVAKGLMDCKLIYWGHGRDLLDPSNRIKNMAYYAQQSMCAAIILYAEHLKKYIHSRFHKKTFVANNTLYLNYPVVQSKFEKQRVLDEYGIKTKTNIICMGRMQKRKRINHLVAAFSQMHRPDIGLILAGPDPEGILEDFEGINIYKLGPVYGRQRFDLLSASDVSCIPGAVGLSIVDSFYCRLPFVTEEGDESPEIMYLKDGVNGFIVPRGNVSALRAALLQLLDDDGLRKQFSAAARSEIEINGSMDKFCSGFRRALCYATRHHDPV